MFDRKIKKLVGKELKKTKTFEEFCAENDIQIVRRQPRKGRIFTAIFAPVAAVLVIGFSIFIPSIFKGNDAPPVVNEPENPPISTPVTPPPPSIIYYADNDVENQNISYNEFKESAKIKLFKEDNIQGCEYVGIITPQVDATNILGYLIQKMVFGCFVENNLYAYQFDCTIRLKENYLFNQLTEFEQLPFELV